MNLKYATKAISLILSSVQLASVDADAGLDELLLSKAVPIKQYEDQLVAAGGERFVHKLNLGGKLGEDSHPSFMQEETNYSKNSRKLGGYYYKKVYYDDDSENDDYFNLQKELSFQGYSMKFATCQKLQRFSVEAVQRGEYSSMVTDDVVVMRLCPKKSCSANQEYGCSSGFGEYVMDVSEYMTIVMKYQYQRQKNFCSFCDSCSFVNYYQYSANGGNATGNDDDAAAGNNADQYNAYYANAAAYQNANEEDQDDAVVQDGDDGDDGVEDANENQNQNENNYEEEDQDVRFLGAYYAANANTCYKMSSQCKSTCSSNDDDASSNMIDYMSYINYFGCQKQGDNYGNYHYVTPQCDPDTNSIEMGVFYDEYCDQYAGNDVAVYDYLGDDFSTSIFKSVQSSDCIECAENKYPPYYNANNVFCNNVYQNSGQCDAYLAYDLGEKSYSANDDAGDDGDDNTDDATMALQNEVQCSFIESIRYGTYDKYGQIYVNMFQSSNQEAKVTTGQKIVLGVLSGVCIGLAAYSCMIHHEMTNLLLKSLRTGLIGSKKRWVRRRGHSSGSSNRRERDQESDDSSYESGSGSFV